MADADAWGALRLSVSGIYITSTHRWLTEEVQPEIEATVQVGLRWCVPCHGVDHKCRAGLQLQ
jgi:hypothetical protein